MKKFGNRYFKKNINNALSDFLKLQNYMWSSQKKKNKRKVSSVCVDLRMEKGVEMFFSDGLYYRIELKRGERSKVIALYILILLVICKHCYFYH